MRTARVGEHLNECGAVGAARNHNPRLRPPHFLTLHLARNREVHFSRAEVVRIGGHSETPLAAICSEHSLCHSRLEKPIQRALYHTRSVRDLEDHPGLRRQLARPPFVRRLRVGPGSCGDPAEGQGGGCCVLAHGVLESEGPFVNCLLAIYKAPPSSRGGLVGRPHRGHGSGLCGRMPKRR